MTITTELEVKIKSALRNQHNTLGKFDEIDVEKGITVVPHNQSLSEEKKEYMVILGSLDFAGAKFDVYFG